MFGNFTVSGEWSSDHPVLCLLWRHDQPLFPCGVPCQVFRAESVIDEALWLYNHIVMVSLRPDMVHSWIFECETTFIASELLIANW